MPESANRRCPSCGKRPIDRLLIQCPDCHVPFASDHQPSPGLTPDQLTAIAWQILGSWKFWAGLALLVGAAAWGTMEVVQRSFDQRTKEALAALEQNSTNHFAEAYAQISRQISNQVAAEFRQPYLRSTIERVASEQATDLLTNAIWPSLVAFKKSIEQAQAQLAQTTNDIAYLAKDVRIAQRAATQVAPPAGDEPALLSLSNQSITRNGSNYVLTLFFIGTTNKPVGPVDLVAGTFRLTAKIVNFTARNVSDAQPAVMNDTGDASRLQFTATRVGAPILVELELTAPTIVKIMGDALEEELTLPVAADKMLVPTDAR